LKIRFDNVNFNANNGPNGFGVKLAKEFIRQGHNIVHDRPDVQISFIQKKLEFNPCVLRLDGIYFNTRQDWKSQNQQISKSYFSSQSIIVQSKFNKNLVFNYFGERENVYIIKNGTDLEEINKIPALDHEIFNRFENIWMSASHWRPHKRLNENIEYYLENKGSKDCLILCGKGFDENIKQEYRNLLKEKSIFYLGELNWHQLISCMKKSKYFLHLSFLDHCPNVVVDAKAAGCICIVASSGGTKELCNKNDIIIKDLDWDYTPLDLYTPPKLDFTLFQEKYNNADYSIECSYKNYYKVLTKTL
jgi:glycosyltransferase involved in cell wall biosynthesis